jgi:uncharacterized protein (DUF736 family)
LQTGKNDSRNSCDVLSLHETFERDAQRFFRVAIEATIPAVSQQKEKHMIIGKFTQQDDGFIGWINTASLGIADVRFSSVPVKQGNGPDFIVLGTGDNGQFELGAAWAKTSKKGKPYLSVRLDSPAFVDPINCALTKQADGSHALVWSRKDADESAEEQAAA